MQETQLQTMEEKKPGYKKTKLGWIPEGWSIKRIDQIAEVVGGGTPSTNENLFWDDTYQWYTPTDISKFSKFAKKSERTISELGLKKSSAKLFPKGTLMVCTRATIGEIAIASSEATTNQGFKNVIVNEKNDNEFFYYYLVNSKNKLKRLSSGSTFLELSSTDFKKFQVITPPLIEQKKISELLSTWDTAIYNTSKLILKKNCLKKGQIQQLLTGEKRLPGFRGEWKEFKLEKYFKERNEKGFDNLRLLSVGEAGVYPQSDSNKKDTSNKDKSKYKRICPGDIGYNTMRLWQGRNALSQLEGIISPAYTVVTPKENAHAEFFKYLFKLPEVVHKFYRNSQGLVSDTLNCKFKDFKIVKVMLPPSLDEQMAIANIILSADKEIKLLKKKKEMLQTQKKGLMQQLLTGKKRLTND